MGKDWMEVKVTNQKTVSIVPDKINTKDMVAEE